MNNDRPIIFTIQERRTGVLTIGTNDPRGRDEEVFALYPDELFKVMGDITEVLNEQGYAVMFEAEE